MFVDRFKKLERALFIVGEIGLNDYIASLNVKSIEDIRHNMVPEIVQATMDAVKVSFLATKLLHII